MIEHVWSVACSRAIIDKDSNNISLINVLEQITIEVIGQPKNQVSNSGETVIPATFEIASLWIRSGDQPAKGTARILMQKPGATAKVIGEPFDIDLTEFQRLRTRTGFGGFPVGDSGVYWFTVQQMDEGKKKWKVVARLPILLKINYPS